MPRYDLPDEEHRIIPAQSLLQVMAEGFVDRAAESSSVPLAAALAVALLSCTACFYLAPGPSFVVPMVGPTLHPTEEDTSTLALGASGNVVLIGTGLSPFVEYAMAGPLNSRLRFSGGGLLGMSLLPTAGLQARAAMAFSPGDSGLFSPEIGINSSLTAPWYMGHAVVDVGFSSFFLRDPGNKKDLGGFYFSPRLSAGGGLFPDWGLHPNYQGMGPAVAYTDVFSGQAAVGMMWGSLSESHFVEASAAILATDFIAAQYRDGRRLGFPGSAGVSFSYGMRWGQ
jgi:hypothetical protein